MGTEAAGCGVVGVAGGVAVTSTAFSVCACWASRNKKPRNTSPRLHFVVSGGTTPSLNVQATCLSPTLMSSSHSWSWITVKPCLRISLNSWGVVAKTPKWCLPETHLATRTHNKQQQPYRISCTKPTYASILLKAQVHNCHEKVFDELSMFSSATTAHM